MRSKNLEIKNVPFMGSELMAARDDNGQIFAGVRWVCDGIGLSKGQMQRQVTNIGSDKVLSKGVANLQLPTNGGLQEVLCLNLDFVPLWLAKIRITPAMERESPELSERLEQYQLKAKYALAEAFLPGYRSHQLPQTYSAAIRSLADAVEKREALERMVGVQHKHLLEMEPKAAFADAVHEAKSDITIEKFAKLLYDKIGLKIGRNGLFRLLRDMGYLQENNLPYQKYMKAGYFSTRELLKDGHPVIQTLTTGKGQTYLFDRIMDTMCVPA